MLIGIKLISSLWKKVIRLRGKNMIKVSQMPKKHLLLIVLISFGLLVVNVYSFYLQANGIILSDLGTHISFALEGDSDYSILHVLISLFYAIGGDAVLVSIFLAVLSLLSLWAGWALLMHLAPAAHSLLLFFVSLACNVEMAFYIPWIGPLYLGSYAAGVWHNPTYMVIKPLAVLCFLFFLRVWKNYREGSFWKDYIVFTLLLTLSTWAKPSFVMSFGPVIFILLLWDFIKGRGKNLGRTVIVGLSLLPSLLVALGQSLLVFNESDSIAFGYAIFLRQYIQYPIGGLLKSIVFPVIVLVICHKVSKNAAWWAAVLNTIFSVGYAFFLYETGRRLADGNFTWGTHIAVFLLFLVTSSILFQWQAEKNIISSGSAWQKTGFWISCALLIAHAVFGIGYFILFNYVTHSYLL